jgi:hypothetical protein
MVNNSVKLPSSISVTLNPGCEAYFNEKFVDKGFSNSDTGFLIVDNNGVDGKNYRTCEFTSSFLVNTSKGIELPIQSETNLTTIYRKRKNVARLLPTVVESHANMQNKKWKDEKEEQFRALERGEEKTHIEAYDGVEEIKVTDNVSYVTSTNHHQTGNWIVRCPTITEKKPWWNLGLFSPTVSETSVTSQQERYNNNLLLHEVPKKRVGRHTEYNQQRQQRKQILQGRNYANQLKQSTNNYKLDGPTDEDRLPYICDINDKQKVYNAAAAPTFVVGDRYYDDCIRNQQPLIEKNAYNDKPFHAIQQQNESESTQQNFYHEQRQPNINGCNNKDDSNRINDEFNYQATSNVDVSNLLIL